MLSASASVQVEVASAESVRLVELQPKFLVIDRSNVQRREVDDIRAAQGLLFACPKCRRCSVERQHSVVCWFSGRNVPIDEMPIWNRLGVRGDGYEDLTVAGMIVVRGGCLWRGQIRWGYVLTSLASGARPVAERRVG